MVRRGDTYSSIIAWLKILLPLAALTLLSTLFLVPRQGEPDETLPFLQGRDPGTAGREQIVSPRYAGTTAEGDRLALNAESAELVDGHLDRVLAHTLDGQLDLTDGSRITLNAREALVDESDRRADLRGQVHIVSSSGYDITTERLLTALDRIDAETLAPVSGKGPAGSFTAGKLVIRADGASEDVQLLFTEGVKLIYDPKNP